MVFRAIRTFGKPGFLTIAPIGSVQIAVNPTTAHDPLRLPIPLHRHFAIGAVGSGIVWSRVVAVPGVKTRARIKMGLRQYMPMAAPGMGGPKTWPFTIHEFKDGAPVVYAVE